MRTKILVLSAALVLSANLRAQVSIGDLTAPAKGALLDLNKAVKGGLTLSNVKLDNLYTIPATFPGMSSPPADVNTKFTGAIVYHTGENGIAAGIYVWNGTNWAPVEENCLPADSLTVTLSSSAVLAKTGAPVTFSVSTGVGARCAEGETYDWYQAAGANAYGAVGSTAYPASNKAIAFSPANTYKVKVEASNMYSASAKATSNEVTVYVTDDASVPSSLYGDNYDVAGPPCYDVYRSSTEPESGYTARADSFANGYGKTYSFVYNGVYSDLQVSYEDPHGLVDHIIQPANTSNPAASGKEPFTVVFKSGVKSSVPVSDRDTVKLLVSYKVGTEAKLALRNIRIQDAACHCPVRIDRRSDRWLTFACHNLGGEDITSDSQTLTRAHHGDWYRWGAKEPSLRNLDATTDALPAVWNYEGNAYPPYTPYYDYDGVNDWLANNPCPAGWRLPTISEFAAAVNKTVTNTDLSTENNVLDYLGTWDSAHNPSNFSAFLKVGDHLYLPAAGSRSGSDALLQGRGYFGYYWSSSVKNVPYYERSDMGWTMHFQKTSGGIYSSGRFYGYSVRCVAAE